MVFRVKNNLIKISYPKFNLILKLVVNNLYILLPTETIPKKFQNKRKIYNVTNK